MSGRDERARATEGRAETDRTADGSAGLGWDTYFHPIPMRKTFEYVTEAILEGIDRAGLQPGAMLPRATDLAGQLGVSLPTLRQGLRVLERAGVLAVRPGAAGGIFLLNDMVEMEFLDSRIAVEEQKVHAVLAARRVTETAITHYSMDHCDDADIEEIERAQDLMAAHLGDPKMFRIADSRFHRAVLHGTHNDLLVDMMNKLRRRIIPIQDAYINDLISDQHSLDVHTWQMEAMRAKDGVALDRALDEHFKILEDAFRSALADARG